MKLADLAEKLGAALEGDGTLDISSVAGLREAQPGDLSFLSNPKYQRLLQSSAASAVLVAQDQAVPEGCTAALLRVENPDASFAQATSYFCPAPMEYLPGIHETAVIEEGAVLGSDCHVGAGVVIQRNAKLGDRCRILAGAVVGVSAQLGDDVQIASGAVLREHVVLGDRVIVHNNAVIGSDGFGYTVESDGSRTKVPQVGIVRIGDDAEIGACVCIDRARFGETRIGVGVKIDNLVQIAHNVVVEDHAVLVAQVGISGSSVVKDHAILAGQVGVAGHLEIGSRAVVGAQGGVTKDVKPGTYVWGTPATPFESYSKTLSNVNRLPKLQKRVSELEARLKALEEASGEASSDVS